MDAFAELAHRYRHLLFRLAYRFAGTTEDADDLCQDCLLRAFQQIRRYDHRRPFRPWFFKVCSNVCVSAKEKLQRRSRNEEALDLELFEASSKGESDVAARALDRRWILEELEALPAPIRIVLILRFVAEMSFREIAEATGSKLSTVAYRVDRGLDALRQAVASDQELRE